MMLLFIIWRSAAGVTLDPPRSLRPGLWRLWAPPRPPDPTALSPSSLQNDFWRSAPVSEVLSPVRMTDPRWCTPAQVRGQTLLSHQRGRWHVNTPTYWCTNPIDPNILIVFMNVQYVVTDTRMCCLRDGHTAARTLKPSTRSGHASDEAGGGA